MNQLALQLAEGRDAYRPREVLRGTATWQLAGTPTAIEVRLCWFVEVQGAYEVRRVQTVRYDRPLANEHRQFEFLLPDAPYSYAGVLAVLGWAVELVALPDGEFAQAAFNLGPHADVLELRRQLESTQ